MTLPRLGHAVIVNNVASEMPGSLRDVEALKAAYKTIGFDVQVHNDCGEKVPSLQTKTADFIITTCKIKKKLLKHIYFRFRFILAHI